MAATEQRQTQTGWQAIVYRCDKVLMKIEHIFTIVAAGLLFLMIAAVSYSVIGRRFFDLPGAWAVELSEYAMLYLTFLLAPWVLKQDGHVRVDVLVSRLGPQTQFLFGLIAGVAAAISCLVLFWFSLDVALDSYQRDVILRRILQVPQYMLLAVIPLGSLFLFLRFACQILRQLSSGWPREASP